LHSFVVLCETNILSLVSQNLDNFYQIQMKCYRNSDTVFFSHILWTKRGLSLGLGMAKFWNRVVKLFTMPLPCTDTVTFDTRPTEKLGNFRPWGSTCAKGLGIDSLTMTATGHMALFSFQNISRFFVTSNIWTHI
jgi:hypothetical protein